MIAISVKIPNRQKVALANLLSPKRVAWAEAQAVNRTAANTKDLGLKRVAKEMGLPVSKLAKRGRRTDWRGSSKFGAFSQVKKANRSRLRAVLRGVGKPFNINRWKNTPIYEGSRSSIKTGKQTRKRTAKRVIGVTHTAWGDVTTIGNVWRLANGAYMVRDGKTFRSVYGPGVTHVLGYPHIAKLLRWYAQRRFTHHFKVALAYSQSNAFHGR